MIYLFFNICILNAAEISNEALLMNRKRENNNMEINIIIFTVHTTVSILGSNVWCIDFD